MCVPAVDEKVIISYRTFAPFGAGREARYPSNREDPRPTETTTFE